MDVEKIIDVFHFPNHVSTDCKKKYNPEKVKTENPTFNTQAGEQTFVWVGRFKHTLRHEQDSSSILLTPHGEKKEHVHNEVLQKWKETYSSKEVKIQ